MTFVASGTGDRQRESSSHTTVKAEMPCATQRDVAASHGLIASEVFEANRVHVTPSSLDKQVRQEVVESLMAERRELRTQARLGTLSETNTLLLSEVQKQIELLQQIEVAELRVADQDLWKRLEAAARALDPALFK